MTTAEDIHGYRQRIAHFERSLQSSPNVSREDYELIQDYKRHSLLSGITEGRVARHLFDLRLICEWLECELTKASVKDIEKLVLKIEESHYAPSVKRDLKLTIRRFFRWLKKTDDYPPEVRWIKARIKETKIKSPEEMLSEADVLKIINQCRTDRDRALVSTLYESGCRVGELIPIMIKHVCFDEYGALLHVTGKTGYRRVRIHACVPALKKWLNNHPDRGNPEAYVWYYHGKYITYTRFCVLVREAAHRAGIKKSVNPHNFRHSRATFLANHLTEAQMKVYFGWVQASKMASIYVHLSGRDVDNSLLSLYGIKMAEEGKKSTIIPVECPQCRSSNPAGSQYCSFCGTVLSEDLRAHNVRIDMERKDAEETLNTLASDPAFMRMLAEKIMGIREDHPQTPQPPEGNTIKAVANGSSWKKPTEPDASVARICAPTASPTASSPSARRANARYAGRGSSGSTTCGGAGNEGKD